MATLKKISWYQEQDEEITVESGYGKTDESLMQLTVLQWQMISVLGSWQQPDCHTLTYRDHQAGVNLRAATEFLKVITHTAC